MEDSKSKSQKKRDAEALRTLGLQLVALSTDQLATFPLTDALQQALLEAKKLKSHGAIRRQAQFIGKLMRKADAVAIQTAYDALQLTQGTSRLLLHATETWRTRLLEEGEAAIHAFIEQYHPDDPQHLQQLIKKTHHAAGRDKLAASRALFRYVRTYLS